MTCVSAFGFAPGSVFAYQSLRDEEHKRAVMDLYLKNFSEHRITPYDPAPMDSIGISWTGLPKWQGGEPDTETRHEGNASRHLDDPHTNQNVPSPMPNMFPFLRKACSSGSGTRRTRPASSF